MSRHFVVKYKEADGQTVYGVACGAWEVQGVTADVAVARELAEAFNGEGLSAEHLGDVLEDFARDPGFFLRNLRGEGQKEI